MAVTFSAFPQGDFTYDQVVDIRDAADLVATGLFDAGTYNPPAGSFIAVPEPSTCGLALAGLACGGRQLRRRRAAPASAC